MTKQLTISRTLTHLLVGGAVYVTSLAMPTLAMSSETMMEDNSQAQCSAPLSRREKAQRQLWPAIHPAVAKVTRPKFAELAQPSGPRRDEYRLWPIVHYPAMQKRVRPSSVELAQTSGPRRDEYRLWPVPFTAPTVSPQANENGIAIAGTPTGTTGHNVCSANVKPVRLAVR